MVLSDVERQSPIFSAASTTAWVALVAVFFAAVAVALALLFAGLLRAFVVVFLADFVACVLVVFALRHRGLRGGLGVLGGLLAADPADQDSPRLTRSA